MKLLQSQKDDSIGIEVNTISFSSLKRALRTLSGLKILYAKYHFNDEALIVFEYKNIEFEVITPISDYWLDKPNNCSDEIFQEIKKCLEKYNVKWWQKYF